jgi:PAS domain S-box-containing protein
VTPPDSAAANRASAQSPDDVLSTQRRLYEAILTNTPDLAYVFDLEHRFIYANEGLLRMWGRSWDEAIGRNCLELGYEPWHAAMHDREIEQVIATKQPVRGLAPFNGTFGRRIYDYLFVPVLDRSGEVEAVAGTTRDVTERLQAEQALRESEERLQLALEVGRSATWDWDFIKNEFTVSSSYRPLHGLAAHAAVSYEQWLSEIHPSDRQRVRLYGETFFRDGTQWDVRYRVQHPEHGERWLQSTGRLERDNEGRPRRFIGVSYDITHQKQTQDARKALEASLREADRRKDEFLATLAHELRNPLAPIQSAAQLLKVIELGDPRGRQARDIIDRQVRHMVRLIDDLMDVSRITLGQITLRDDEVSLRSVLTDAIESAGPLIESLRHTLHVHLPAEPMTLQGDATRLSQIFQNLLNNAAKYTPAGGEIHVRAERVGSDVKVCVSDNGIGIPLDSQHRIFELFTRVHAQDFTNSRGLGIGLALARQLVELHGGRLQVHSEGAGTGSEFAVFLPLRQQAPHAATAGFSKDSACAPSHRRVLVVDDNRDAAESLKMLLETLGCKVRAAFSGMEAISAVPAFRPEVILLDIGMPDLSGYEVAQQLRARPDCRGVMLIALTGWGQPQDRQRAAEAGFDHHLTKPVDPSVLTMLIRVERGLSG